MQSKEEEGTDNKHLTSAHRKHAQMSLASHGSTSRKQGKSGEGACLDCTPDISLTCQVKCTFFFCRLSF